MKTASASIYRILVLALTCLLIVTGAQASGQPDADFIASALEQQEAACGASLQVQFVVGPPNRSLEKDFAQLTVSYIRTAGFLSKAVEVGRLTPSDELKIDCNTRHLYDRKSGAYRTLTTFPTGDRKEGTMSTGPLPAGSLGVGGIVDPVLHHTSFGFLHKAIKEGVVADAMEEIDGHDCWRVDIAKRQIGSHTFSQCSIWVDPSIGFCPRRIITETVSENGANAYITDFSDYRAIGEGVHFPFNVKASIRDDKGTRVVSESKVQKAVCDEQVPSEDLTLSFPPGARVYDMDQGVTIELPAETGH